MLGQHRRQPVLSWSIILAAMFLVAIFVLIGTVGSEIDFSLANWGQSAQENVQTSAMPSTAVLRSAKPDFTGGFIPESTMDAQVVPVEVLRTAKPDFAGGAVPEATIVKTRFRSDVVFPPYDEEPNLTIPY